MYLYLCIYLHTKGTRHFGLITEKMSPTNSAAVTGINMTASSVSHAQWNLVCGNAYIMEIVQPSFLVGAIVGGFVQGPLSDRYVHI